MLWFNGKGGHFVGTPSVTNTFAPPHLTALSWLHLMEKIIIWMFWIIAVILKALTLGPPKFPVLNVVSGLGKNAVGLRQATAGFRARFGLGCSQKEWAELSSGLHSCGRPFCQGKAKTGLSQLRSPRALDHEQDPEGRTWGWTLGGLGFAPSSATNEPGDLGESFSPLWASLLHQHSLWLSEVQRPSETAQVYIPQTAFVHGLPARFVLFPCTMFILLYFQRSDLKRKPYQLQSEEGNC